MKKKLLTCMMVTALLVARLPGAAMAFVNSPSREDEDNGGNELPVVEAPAGVAPVVELPVIELPVGEVPAGEIAVGEVPVGEGPLYDAPPGYMWIEDPDNPGRYILALIREKIEDEGVPMANSPQTGQSTQAAVIVLTVISGAGAAALLLKARKKSIAAV